jgi:hypothetical protein
MEKETDENTQERRRMNTKQVWMEEVVKAAIAKAMENQPEGPNRDYWTTETAVKDIKAKYGLKRFKPKPLKIVLVRECCGEKFVHVLTARQSTICLKDPQCADPECRRRLATLPFGKFKGQTLSWVYEQQPSYLAWFHETVDGCENVKEAIRALDGIETHLVAFRQKQRQPLPQKPLTSTQQQVEWLMGKFTTQTIDTVCDQLFGGEG